MATFGLYYCPEKSYLASVDGIYGLLNVDWVQHIILFSSAAGKK